MMTIALAVSLYLLAVFGDRLRQISWRTTKPCFVLLYLTHMLWASALVYEAFTGSFDWHDAAGAAAMMVLICITRGNWADGPSESFRHGSSHLRQPDL